MTYAPLRLFLLLVGGIAWCWSEVHVETIAYQDGEVELEGVLAFDDARGQERRPGILVVHEWWGLNEYAKSRAKQLAQLGYVAFAIDMYGKGVRTRDPQEAAKLAAPLRTDRALMRARANAGLARLREQPLVASDSIAAVGYCFGGTVALELARSGAPLKGVIAFHGGLAAGTDAKGSPMPAQKGTFRAKVLALQGADDPFVPAAEVAGFADEMRAAGADWQLVQYGGAVHAFTNPAAGSDPAKGMAYNESADHRSWAAMREFLAVELFPQASDNR
ncbi:MAG: dienelactone hydrolase family protein [Planctomycetes bacterium]|nr:dienelactone hydrolase family protein [Planctomycetota bacterium]